MQPPIACGGVYRVADQTVTLLPEEERVLHTTRRSFLVLSGDGPNQDPDWAFVLGCPLSTSDKWQTEFDVLLKRGEANLDADVWVRVPALQPLMKNVLEDFSGRLLAHRLEVVQAQVVYYMGLIDRPRTRA